MLIEAYILAWGIQYLMVALIKPSMLKRIGEYEVPKWLSLLSMLLIGFLMVSSLFLQFWLLYLALGLFEAFGVCSNYLRLVEWDTPMGDNAYLAMACLDLMATVCLFSKVM